MRCVHIRHFRVGYLLILLTPVLSFTIYIILLLLVGVTLAVVGVHPEYSLSSLLFAASNISTMTLLLIGIGLYPYGYLRQQTITTEAKVLLPFGLFLVLWDRLFTSSLLDCSGISLIGVLTLELENLQSGITWNTGHGR